jgi:hypothetical protein
MASSHPLLLGATIATGGFCPSLLCYHCSDIVVAMVGCLWIQWLTGRYSEKPWATPSGGGGGLTTCKLHAFIIELSMDILN